MGRATIAVLASVLALAALTAGSASASGPVWASCGKTVPKNTGAYTDKACSVESPGHEGKYEVLDGIGKGKGFKGKMLFGGTLYGVAPPGEFNLKCKKGTISGVYVAPDKVAGVHINWSKCKTNISSERKTCVLSTQPLSGRLGWIDQAEGEAGLMLTSEAEPETGLIAEIQGCVEEVKQRWRGAAIAAWSPAGRFAKESVFGFAAEPFVEEGNPRGDMRSNLAAFEGEEGIHILRSELNDIENGFEWSTAGGNAGGLEAGFLVKGEALIAH
jgi:hypothetical protein